MVCLGSSKLFMGPASELGPVDPQQVYQENYESIHHIIDTYHKLFQGAEGSKGNLEPYIQQLSNYDANLISHLENELDLASDMAVRCLHSGMLSTTDPDTIKQKMKVFLLPEHTKAHGRPIYRDEAASCGLAIDAIDPKSKLWELVYELHIRSGEYVSKSAAKAIETEDAACYMPVPSSEE